MEDFATVDDDLVVCADSDILDVPDSEIEDEEEDDSAPQIEPPSRDDVFSAIKILKNYAATNNVSIGLYESINKVPYDFANNLKVKEKCKQTNIKDYIN